MAYVLITQFSLAQMPKTISYQGFLTDPDGTIINDGEYDMVFRLYAVDISGIAIWTEDHPDTQVISGVFSVILG